MSTKTKPSPQDLGVEVGDFFVSSWGYDQTNIDFYKVVGLTKKGVKVQHWTKKHVGEVGGPQEAVVPGDEPVTGAWVKAEGGWSEYDKDATAPVEQKFLSSYSVGEERVYFSVNSFASAYKWDGRPKYQTGLGWGH